MIIAVGVYSSSAAPNGPLRPEEQGDEEACDNWRHPHASVDDGEQELSPGEAAHCDQHPDRQAKQ
jgi:hypothetical protein